MSLLNHEEVMEQSFEQRRSLKGAGRKLVAERIRHYASENTDKTRADIARHFNVHESRVREALSGRD